MDESRLGGSRAGKVYDTVLANSDTITSFPWNPLTIRCLAIAILEAWADGLIDDTYLHAEIAKYHKELKECSHCLENVEYYRSRRLQQCSGTDAR